MGLTIRVYCYRLMSKVYNNRPNEAYEKGRVLRMSYTKLCDSDYRFMCIVWEHAPIGSGELVKLCAEQLGWKKSTTYTVIKKLSEKGYIENKDALVEALIPKERVQAEESEYFVERTFGGSLPGFVAAFLSGKRISREETALLKQMIDAHEEE